jgi:5-methylcytosine-specific restriction enzyme A
MRHPYPKTRRTPQAFDGSSARPYNDSAWRIGRLQHLLASPLCVVCAARGRTTRATEVDHIRPHRGDRALFFDRSNWQSLCRSCHSSKTNREDGGFGNQTREKA